MRALEVLAIYLTPFLILGAAVKFWMRRHAVELRDVQRHAGGAPKRRFLFGAWRTDDQGRLIRPWSHARFYCM